MNIIKVLNYILVVCTVVGSTGTPNMGENIIDSAPNATFPNFKFIPLDEDGRFSNTTELVAEFRQGPLPLPCTCALGLCTCCTGFILELFRQKTCAKIRYIPEDFAFDISMEVNEKIMYKNRMSGKNPSPACFSLPRFPNAKLCAKLSNIFFPGRNIHFCVSMMGVFNTLTLFDLSFDCVRMGAQGLAIVKPEDDGGLPIVNPDGSVDADVDAGDDDIEDYDENVVRSLLEMFNY